MASDISFVTYAAEQLGGAGEVTFRPMMGEYCLYFRGKCFGSVCDNIVYISPTERGKAVIKDAPMSPPYVGAKPKFVIENLEDKELLATLVTETWADLPAPKARKKQ